MLTCALPYIEGFSIWYAWSSFEINQLSLGH